MGKTFRQPRGTVLGHDLLERILAEVTQRMKSRMEGTPSVDLELGYLRAQTAVRRAVGAREGRNIRDDLGPDELLRAASALAWAGERADIAPLFALANRIGPLREACGASVEALLGRTNAGVGGESGLQALASWWDERRYALDVPSPDWRNLSTR